MKIKQNVAVDIGNTQIKYGIFENNQLVEKNHCQSLQKLAETLPDGVPAIFASVREQADEIHQIFPKALLLSHQTSLPLQLDYRTPETLGVDRIAAVAGAQGLFPHEAVLVIDAGSCITYDLIDTQGVYQGGVISPGLKMRMRAMAQQTKRLPDISGEWEEIDENLLGKSTRECLLNGTLTSISHEMDGFIASYSKEFEGMRVILTGGDGRYFESKLKAPIFADFDLVLIGLNRILIHNQ